jgi:Smg protein
MFDILAYLYENCHHADLSQDSARVVKKLSAAGFDDSEISEALAWLDGMARIPQRMILKQPEISLAVRHFAERECDKLEPACRGFIMHLEHIGIIDASLREVIIDRAMATNAQMLSLEQLKIIVLMVLWNRDTPANQLLAEELLSEHEDRLPN